MSAKVTIELSEEMDEKLTILSEHFGASKAAMMGMIVRGFLSDLNIDDDSGGDDHDGQPIPVEEAA